MNWKRSCETGVCGTFHHDSPALRGCRLAPCLLRSREDFEATSLVAAFLLRHFSNAEGADVSVIEAAPALSSSRAPAIAPTQPSVTPTIHKHSPATATLSAAHSAAPASSSGPAGPPPRLPPPLPKSAPGAAVVPASGGEFVLPLNKSRSRSGSMEGNAGYASFKKELQVIVYCVNPVRRASFRICDSIICPDHMV